MLGIIAKTLEDKLERIGDNGMIISRVDVDKPSQLRDISFQIRSRYPNLSLVLGAEIEGKAHLSVMLADKLINDAGLNASQIIREVSVEIQGGGGGQPFFATAGGKNPAGIDKALSRARTLIVEALS